MIRIARDLDLLTTPYVFSEADATAMEDAGADILIAHVGLTTGGTIGAKTALKFSDCPKLIDAYPGDRLGERACAFVRLRQSLMLADVVVHLEQTHMARQYFPERLIILEEMPRTPTGKVQKFKLREMAVRAAVDV